MVNLYQGTNNIKEICWLWHLGAVVGSRASFRMQHNFKCGTVVGSRAGLRMVSEECVVWTCYQSCWLCEELGKRVKKLWQTYLGAHFGMVRFMLAKAQLVCFHSDISTIYLALVGVALVGLVSITLLKRRKHMTTTNCCAECGKEGGDSLKMCMLCK
jgi:LPXTG-motif cell wall-anchored protein